MAKRSEKTLTKETLVLDLNQKTDKIINTLKMDKIYFCLFNLNQLRTGNRFDEVNSFDFFTKHNLITEDLDEYVDYLLKAPNNNSEFLTGAISKVSNIYFINVFGLYLTVHKMVSFSHDMTTTPLDRLNPSWVSNFDKIEDVVSKAKLNNFIDLL